ncbi:MAG: NAD(P)/FAD-dependent oxidoreductase [Maricaulaceae bacterium]
MIGSAEVSPISPLPSNPKPKIAVVGSGAAGLGAAWALRDAARVTLFEQEGRLGGHANTVRVDYDGADIPVDTGFIVFNTGNYPNFSAWLEHLGVKSRSTDMSFGFSIEGGVEWCSNGARGVFARKRNALTPSFLGMLRDVMRFNARAPRDLRKGRLENLSLGDYLDRLRASTVFRRNYLLPMGAAIWSAAERDMLDYPAAAFIRFFKNHRLTHFVKPQWRTVLGGSIQYVERVAQDLGPERIRLNAGVDEVIRRADGVDLVGRDGQAERFDEVVLACHPDVSLKLLADPDPHETEALGAFRYADNQAVLHRDLSFVPQRTAARAAWNYMRARNSDAAHVTYDMNRLQGIDPSKPLFVTLNPRVDPDPALTFARFTYRHPQYDLRAIAMQRRFNAVQGVRRTWFAGAWLGYGFHEDALRAGLRVALRLGGSAPWPFVEGDMPGGAFGARGGIAAAAAAAE